MSSIELVQNPIIKQNLVETGKSVTKRLKDLNIDNQVATIDTVKSLKDLRVDLNKELADFEAQRKFIKESVLSPYNEFEALYKTEISEKYKSAIDTLKDKIALVEDQIKKDKKISVMAYFDELCLSEKIEFLTFENVGLEINLSTTEKAYKEKCNEYVQRVVDDLALIDTQECKAEIIVEYRTTLNASRAIKTVQDRKEKERIEAERLRLQEIQTRKNMLGMRGFSFDTLLKSYEYDNDIFISFDEVENLSKDDFKKKLLVLEMAISTKKRAEEDIKREEARVAREKQEAEVRRDEYLAPEYKEENIPVCPPPIVAPLQAPVVAAPQKVETPAPQATPVQQVVATFEVTGTREQIYSVRDFLIQNNINYTNV